MPPENQLIDTDRLARNRERALRMNGDFFLYEEAKLEIEDHISMVKRDFTDVAIVSGFPEIWKKWFPNATHVLDNDTLDITEQSFDLVIHAMSLHWANDPVGQMIQCNRALRPDGLFIAGFLGDRTLHELRACLGEAETKILGGLSPRVLPMPELRDLGGLLQRASFALPVADKITQHVSYASLPSLAKDLRAMGEGNALSQRSSNAKTSQVFDLAETLYRNHYSEGGRLLATFDMVFLTGWAPAPSQPKPLMPGSAKTRLSDALSTEEFKLPKGD